MPDTDDVLRTLVWAGICIAGMAVLVTGIALALGTTGHDWYAAWKFTVVKMMLGLGFSDHGLIEYRLAAGVTINIERFRFVHGMDEAWSARRLIFSLVVDRAVLGACTGFALFAMWLAAETVAHLREFGSGRGAVVEPPRARREYAGRMRRPEDWSDSELIAALARRSGGAGVLLVSPDQVERLAGGGVNAAGRPAAPRNALPPAQTPGLPPPESARSADAAVPGEPAPAGPGSRPDTTEADNPSEGNPARDHPADDKAVARGREPGEQFF